MNSMAEILRLVESIRRAGNETILIPESTDMVVEGGGNYRKYEYLVCLNDLGIRVGYIALLREHPYSKIEPLEDGNFDYGSLDIHCHGGLSYMGFDHTLKRLIGDINPRPDSEMWIGFDCGNFNDLFDVDACKKYFGEEHYQRKMAFFNILNFYIVGRSLKTFEYVEKECHSIIDQLIKIDANEKCKH